jgi:S-layer homology domain.
MRTKYIFKLVLMNMLAVMLAFGFFVSDAKAETSNNVSAIIDLTGIMRDSSGNSVVGSKFVTREELAQMLVQASPYAQDVNGTNKLKLFSDVQKDSKKGVYIQIAVTKGYMSGYLGGKFKPENTVTLKEAVYGTLGILGYTNDDFAGKLSDARYEAFKEAGLSKNLTCGETDKLTKKDCETLFYNLLNAKQKSGTVYATVLGYSVKSDNEVDYQSVLTKKSKGPFIAEAGWEKKLSGKLSSYTVMLNEKKASVKDIKNNCIIYYADQAKKIWAYNKKAYGMLENITFDQEQPQQFTVAGTSYPVEKPDIMKESLKTDGIQKGTMVVLLLGRDNKVSGILPIKTALASDNPTKLGSLNLKYASIYKNESEAVVKDIHKNDVMYYSPKLKTVWAFDKKVYGILDSITWNNGDAQAFTIAGTSYTVQDASAMKKEIKKSSIQNGDPVILLFGWDEKVAKIVKLSSLVAEGIWENNMGFDIGRGTIYKDGVKISGSEIESADVIYYSNELQTLWVYRKKAYGVLNSTSPKLSLPESVVVAGVTYKLDQLPVNSSATATGNAEDLMEYAWGKRLQDNGIKEGDNVVVLFGYNGKVADIRKADKMPVSIAGYVLSVDKKVVTDEKQNSSVSQVIHVIDTEGITRDFQCTDNSIAKGMVVEVNFKDGAPVITKATISSSSIPSNITSFIMAEDAHILDVKDQSFSKLTKTELKESNWNAGNVLYYKVNSSNEITDIILNKASNALYQYMVFNNTTSAGDNNGTQINVITNQGAKTFTLDSYSWDINPGPKAVQIENGSIKDTKNLEKFRISYISGKQANADNTVYRIADDVLVCFYKNGKYYNGSFDDIASTKSSYIYGYMLQSQGPVQIIIVMV